MNRRKFLASAVAAAAAGVVGVPAAAAVPFPEEPRLLPWQNQVLALMQLDKPFRVFMPRRAGKTYLRKHVIRLYAAGQRPSPHWRRFFEDEPFGMSSLTFGHLGEPISPYDTWRVDPENWALAPGYAIAVRRPK